MKLKKPKKLAISIFLTLLAGAISSIFTYPSILSWYVYLKKPALTPPNWVFAPVWTALYILMGVAAYLVWIEKKNKKSKPAMQLYWAQLALNSAWSIVFFGLQQLFASSIIIVLLLALIALTILKFKKISKKAAYLLVPYILWVTFASYLNISVWLLNT